MISIITKEMFFRISSGDPNKYNKAYCRINSNKEVYEQLGTSYFVYMEEGRLDIPFVYIEGICTIITEHEITDELISKISNSPITLADWKLTKLSDQCEDLPLNVFRKHWSILFNGHYEEGTYSVKNIINREEFTFSIQSTTPYHWTDSKSSWLATQRMKYENGRDVDNEFNFLKLIFIKHGEQYKVSNK